MSKFNLIQTQLNALQDAVVEETNIGTFNSEAEAVNWLTKRGYKFDETRDAYIVGNTTHFPVRVEEQRLTIFDIQSFI